MHMLGVNPMMGMMGGMMGHPMMPMMGGMMGGPALLGMGGMSQVGYFTFHTDLNKILC